MHHPPAQQLELRHLAHQIFMTLTQSIEYQNCIFQALCSSIRVFECINLIEDFTLAPLFLVYTYFFQHFNLIEPFKSTLEAIMHHVIKSRLCSRQPNNSFVWLDNATQTHNEILWALSMHNLLCRCIAHISLHNLFCAQYQNRHILI